MMRRLALSLLALAACDDTVTCPAVEFVDAFDLTVDEALWSTGSYSVDVSYQDRFGTYAYRCAAEVPTLAWDGAIDGGVSRAAAEAGTYDFGNYIACMNLMPTGRRAYGIAGQALVLRFEGAPTSAHVIVREDGAVRYEQDIAIDPKVSHPFGRACGGSKRGVFKIDLPPR